VHQARYWGESFEMRGVGMRMRELGEFLTSAMAIAGVALILSVTAARATYSIAACDAKMRECGVAVQTNNLAVGASVPYAEAGVGAVVSQFETNPNYGRRGLMLLSQGKSPSEILQLLLKEDGNFEGQGPEARQVAIVALDGRVAAHSGEEVMRAKWAGGRSGVGYSVQGNGLVGPQVVEAMERAFIGSTGSLEERLMAALSAGDAAGGQVTGRESAALLVKTPEGWPVDIDLRVDHSADPVAELRALYDMQLARRQMGQARRTAASGNLEQAKTLVIGAVARASSWQRIWLMGADIAIDIEVPELALQYLNIVFVQNPAWAKTTIGDGEYSELGGEPLFQRWVSAEQREEALSEYKGFERSNGASQAARIGLAKQLIEVGYFSEAITLLHGSERQTVLTSKTHSVLADAFAAQHDFPRAIDECKMALEAEPGNVRLRLKLMRLQVIGERGTETSK
jgi:uncharacterized Ntn-hydrolase superfamily protein